MLAMTAPHKRQTMKAGTREGEKIFVGIDGYRMAWTYRLERGLYLGGLGVQDGWMNRQGRPCVSTLATSLLPYTLRCDASY